MTCWIHTLPHTRISIGRHLSRDFCTSSGCVQPDPAASNSHCGWVERTELLLITVHIHMQTNTHRHTNTHAREYTRMLTHTHSNAHAHERTHIKSHWHINTHARVRTLARTHTYTPVKAHTQERTRIFILKLTHARTCTHVPYSYTYAPTWRIQE